MRRMRKWYYLILLVGTGVIYLSLVDKWQVYAKPLAEVKEWYARVSVLEEGGTPDGSVEGGQVPWPDLPGTSPSTESQAGDHPEEGDTGAGQGQTGEDRDYGGRGFRGRVFGWGAWRRTRCFQPARPWPGRTCRRAGGSCRTRWGRRPGRFEPGSGRTGVHDSGGFLFCRCGLHRGFQDGGYVRIRRPGGDLHLLCLQGADGV